MPMLRPTALRSLQSCFRYSGARATARAAPARTQLVAKRFASSGGHGGGHGEPSSDIPWLIGALVVTPPSCWYLWPDSSDHGHGHGHGDHADHGDAHEEQEEPSAEEEQSSGGEEEAVEEADEKEDKPEVEEPKGDDKSEEKSGDKSDDEKDEGESEDKSEQKKDEGKSDEKKDAEKKSETTPGERTFTVGAGKEDKPESVGAATSTSTVGQKLGDKTSDVPASGKPKPKAPGSMEAKQEGMSNTDTKHSIPIDSSSEKSTKSDGSPDTAKAKGTVDPKAPVK